MEDRIINILLDIKADIGDLKKGQMRLEGRMDGLEGRMDKLEADVSELKTDVAVLKEDVAVLKADVAELKSDMTEVKSTVNALGDALLQTSHDVKQLKTKKG